MHNQDDLISELTKQIDAIYHLIEDVIYLTDRRLVKARVEKKLQGVKQQQDEFYINLYRNNENHAVTAVEQQRYESKRKPEDIVFLNATLRGKQFQHHVDLLSHQLVAVETDISRLEKIRDHRMQPINKLKAHVLNPKNKINLISINFLLTEAKELNPEGCFLEQLQMLGSILVRIFTLRFNEVRDVVDIQRKHNEVRHDLNRLFHQAQRYHRQCEEESQSQPKPLN